MAIYTAKVRKIASGTTYLVTTEVGDGNDQTGAELATESVQANLQAALSSLGTAINGLSGVVRNIHVQVVTNP
jgi:hypothetical protein